MNKEEYLKQQQIIRDEISLLDFKMKELGKKMVDEYVGEFKKGDRVIVDGKKGIVGGYKLNTYSGNMEIEVFKIKKDGTASKNRLQTWFDSEITKYE